MRHGPRNVRTFRSSQKLLLAAGQMENFMTAHAAARMAKAWYGSWWRLVFAEVWFDTYVRLLCWRSRLYEWYLVIVRRHSRHSAEITVDSSCHCDLRLLLGSPAKGDCLGPRLEGDERNS